LAVTGMDLLSARLVPAGCDGGWLARLPGAVVFVPDDGEDAREMISACLACAGAMELLGSVGSRLADPRATLWPPFALVAARGADLVAVVHGPVALIAERAGDRERLYGGDAVGSWLNKVLPHVEALHAGRGTQTDGLVDLRDGVVRATGFLLVPRHQPVSRPPAELRQTAWTGDKGAVAGSRVALGARRPVEAESPTVIDPALMPQDATLVEQSVVPSRAQRPLGRLTWDNGEVDHLVGPTLVGRDVALDGAVVAGEMAPLVPSGPNDSMSRVHAELRPSGWDVVVLDRGSTNGTFVWDEASKAWQRLAPGEPQVLRAGAVLAFGERTATFEAAEVHAV
jgi:hypothetical protein